jgi:hypothetical protein
MRFQTALEDSASEVSRRSLQLQASNCELDRMKAKVEQTEEEMRTLLRELDKRKQTALALAQALQV